MHFSKLDHFLPQPLREAIQNPNQEWFPEEDGSTVRSELWKYRLIVVILFINIGIPFIHVASAIVQGTSTLSGTLFYLAFVSFLLLLLHYLRKGTIDRTAVQHVIVAYCVSKMAHHIYNTFNWVWMIFPLHGFSHLLPFFMLHFEPYLGEKCTVFLAMYPMLILPSLYCAWDTQVTIRVSYSQLITTTIHLLIAVPMSYVVYRYHLNQKKLVEILKEKATAASEASAAKTVFISSISHDLRTPLHAIIGLINLLQNSELKSLQETYVCTMKAACNTLIHVINNVLDLSKIEADKLCIQEKETDLFALVQDVADSLEPLAEEKNVELYLDVAVEAESRFLYMDEKCLNQILTNLVSNAIKFTDEGHVLLRIEKVDDNEESEESVDEKLPLNSSRQGPVTLSIRVIDTGRGMTPEFVQTKLYQPFAQENEFKNAKGMEGSGLGLSLCHKLVRKMRGELTVRSEVMQGTEFSFELTMRKASWVNSAIDVALIKQRGGAYIHSHIFGWHQGEVSVSPTSLLQRQQLERIIEEELAEWQDVIKSPTHTTRFALNKVTEPYTINVAVIDDYRGQLLEEHSAGHTYNKEGSHCFILICKLRDCKHVHQSMTYRTITESKKNFCVSLTYPITPFKFHRAMKKCLSHVASLMQRQQAYQVLHTIPASPNGVKMKLLLVEDNPMICQVLSMFLKRNGIDHDIAHNGKMAIDMWQTRPKHYDVIVMDIQMPVMNGYDAVREIRKLERQLNEPPCKIIINSAVAQVEDMQRAKDVGADAYLTKPLNFETLIKAIRGELSLDQIKSG
jgi:signal transduction histidine kinase/CheY-like chemotaxis protein